MCLRNVQAAAATRQALFMVVEAITPKTSAVVIRNQLIAAGAKRLICRMSSISTNLGL